MPTTLTVPELGENVESVDVVKILVEVGQVITAEQPVIEVETEKASVEVPSESAGVVTEIHVSVGQSLCPMLAERGQDTAELAATVSEAIGRPLGASTMFTGAAISFLCPRAVENVTDSLAGGKLPFPLFG